MKYFTLVLLVLPILSCAQKTGYVPAAPKYKINGQEVLYEGYIINRDGARAYTQNREYTGFCFDYLASLPVFKENDTLVMVATSRHDRFEDNEFFYVHKKHIGKETEIPLTNYDLNERYTERNPFDDKLSFGNNCGEDLDETVYSYEESFNAEDYPDVVVTLITEKEFLKARKTAAPGYLIRNKALVKKDSTITIGVQKFRDGYGDGHQPNIYTYIGEYKKLNAYLLEYMCSACEEYSYELIDKNTGKAISSFTNIPVFSKNFEYVMDMGQLFSSSPTVLNAYKWKERDDNTKSTYKEFANWSPMGNGFWGNDNCFYVAVVPSLTAEYYRNEEREVREKAKYNYRYIKIEVKAPTPDKEHY